MKFTQILHDALSVIHILRNENVGKATLTHAYTHTHTHTRRRSIDIILAQINVNTIVLFVCSETKPKNSLQYVHTYVQL